MTYEGKLKHLREIIAAHNEKVGDKERLKVDADKVIAKLEELGATDEESLAELSWEDLMEAGLPKARAKQVAKKFRVEPDEEPAAQPAPAPVQSVPQHIVLADEAERVANLSLKQLVAEYNPDTFENAVGRELARRAQDRPCLAFNEDGTVNVESTEEVLLDIRRGEDPGAHVMIGKKPHALFKVGSRPDERMDVNPLMPHKTLKASGRCRRTNADWSQVSDEAKQLVILAVTDTRELSQNMSNTEVHDLVKLASGEDGADNLRERYPRASTRFDELTEENSLPPLTKQVGQSAVLSRPESDPNSSLPFGSHLRS